MILHSNIGQLLFPIQNQPFESTKHFFTSFCFNCFAAFHMKSYSPSVLPLEVVVVLIFVVLIFGVLIFVFLIFLFTEQTLQS